MNLLVSTMGRFLDVGLKLYDSVKVDCPIENAGFFVADSMFFEKFIADNRIPLGQVSFLKEWEYTKIRKGAVPDWDRIKSYEKELGGEPLWNALLSDRRIFFGKSCKSKQDYCSRYEYEEMMLILDQALCMIDEYFKKLSPDIVLSFGTATMGDYLIYRFAKARNIPYLQLKATKIKNCVALNDSPSGTPDYVVKSYNSSELLDEDLRREAQSYIDEVLGKGLRYEGAILSSKARMAKRLLIAPAFLVKSLKDTFIGIANPTIRRDCHVPCRLIVSFYASVLIPIKAFIIEMRLQRQRKYMSGSEVSTIGAFVFFPLHFEPEVSLQVSGRAYQNQIELIRNIALSVPAGTTILVKEHPRSIGFRSFSYYRKLFEIPNVYLVDPFVPAHHIVMHAKMVTVIAGSIGLEAAICGKPVITFGDVPYNILPDSMVRHVSNVSALNKEIRDLLIQYHYDVNALQKYCAAVLSDVAHVDLYSILLGKKNRFSANDEALSGDARATQGYARLAELCVRRFKMLKPVHDAVS